MFLAINRYVFLSMLIASLVMWPGSSQAAQSKLYVRRRTGFLPRRRSRTNHRGGAKKEGQVTFYTSNTWVAGPVSKEFEKKYPFVKANVWRSDSKEL